jgi:hypothetical protein
MISTERFEEIAAIMATKLPLETHGSNAFDAVTRITVGDIHGMIERIRSLSDLLETLSKPADPTNTEAQTQAEGQAAPGVSQERDANAQGSSDPGQIPTSHEADTHGAVGDETASGKGALEATDGTAGEPAASTAGAGTDTPPESNGDGAGTEADGSVPAAAEGTQETPTA